MDAFAFEKRTLDSGLELYGRTLDTVEWVQITFIVFGGWRMDPVGLHGLAHLVEHVVADQQSQWGNLSGKEDCARRNRIMPVSLGMTGPEFNHWSFRCTRDKLSEVTSLLQDLLRCRPFHYDLQKQKDIMTEEYRKRMVPELQKFLNFRLESYLPDQHPAIFREAPEFYQYITREHVQSFWETYYVFPNMAVFFAGNVTMDEAVKVVAERFQPDERDQKGQRRIIKSLEWPQLGKRHIQISAEEKLGSQSQYEEQPRMALIQRALPCSYGSKLKQLLCETIERVCFEVWRERLGLTYGVDAHNVRWPDADMFYLDTSFNPTREDEYVQLFAELPALVASKGEKAFHDKKEDLVLRDLYADRTISAALEYAIDDVVELGHIETQANLQEELERLTFEQVAKATEELFSEENAMLLSTVP